MILEAREFSVKDMAKLYKNCIDTHVRGNREYAMKWAEFNVSAGPCLTFVDEAGEPLFAIGICLLECHCGMLGSIWAVFSERVKQYKKSSVRTLRKLLQEWLEVYKLEWIWAEVRRDFAEGQNILEHCYFTRTKKETDKHYYYAYRG